MFSADVLPAKDDDAKDCASDEPMETTAAVKTVEAVSSTTSAPAAAAAAAARPARADVIRCGVVPPDVVRFEQLHSQCLRVDNLPPNYKNIVELRSLLSKHGMPPYCQVPRPADRYPAPR